MVRGWADESLLDSCEPERAPLPAGRRTTVLSLGRDFADPRGTFETAYALGPGEAVLVRPDGYVAWAGPAVDVVAAVATLLGRVPATV